MSQLEPMMAEENNNANSYNLWMVDAPSGALSSVPSCSCPSQRVGVVIKSSTYCFSWDSWSVAPAFPAHCR